MAFLARESASKRLALWASVLGPVVTVSFMLAWGLARGIERWGVRP